MMYETINAWYMATPVPLRLAYFLWIVFLSLYWYADQHDQYNSEVRKQSKAIKRITNINWFFPISGGIILFINQLTIIFGWDLNNFMLKIPDLQSFSQLLTFIKTSTIFLYVFPVLGIILMVLGLYIAAKARAALNGYWTTDIVVYEDEYKKLITYGIYAHMRHPIYVAQVLLALGTSLTAGNFFVFIFPYLLYKANKKRAIKEEEELEKIFKNTYLDYKHKVTPCGLKLFN